MRRLGIWAPLHWEVLRGKQFRWKYFGTLSGQLLLRPQARACIVQRIPHDTTAPETLHGAHDAPRQYSDTFHPCRETHKIVNWPEQSTFASHNLLYAQLQVLCTSVGCTKYLFVCDPTFMTQRGWVRLTEQILRSTRTVPTPRL